MQGTQLLSAVRGKCSQKAQPSGKNSLFPINTADLSRRALFFYFCFLPFTEFALKIYTSLFKNQTRSAKKKKKTKNKNPYKTLKRDQKGK